MTTEDIIQRNIVRALRFKYPKAIVFAVPNGGARSKATAGILKATGVLAGVSDLVFIYSGAVVFIEVKTESGRQSDTQKEFERKISEHGLTYILARSAEECLKKLEGFTKSN
jgi:hypothetical protein